MKNNNTVQTISKNTIQSGVKILAAAAIYVALQGCLGAGNNLHNMDPGQEQQAAVVEQQQGLAAPAGIGQLEQRRPVNAINIQALAQIQQTIQTIIQRGVLGRATEAERQEIAELNKTIAELGRIIAEAERAQREQIQREQKERQKAGA